MENPMIVIEQTPPQASPLPGIAHATWAGAADGLRALSIWRQSMAPGAATPPHSHDCDEVVLCLSGWGEVHIDGEVQRFGADSTIVLPRGHVHQLFNTGPMALQTIGIFAATPVATHLPDGQAIDLPWRT
jgi:mannose-6-phosphate isomerase-like protein (cupin superfamily)